MQRNYPDRRRYSDPASDRHPDDDTAESRRRSSSGDWPARGRREDNTPGYPDRAQASREYGPGYSGRDDEGHARFSPRSPYGPENTDSDPRNPQDDRSAGFRERADWHDDPRRVDRRDYGRGNQWGRAGEYGRAHQYREDAGQGFSGDYDWGDGFGRGNERIHDESRLPPASGPHGTPGGQSVRSRSADPGQGSYGGFMNEDPRLQRQQLDDYTAREQGSQRRYGRHSISPKGYKRSDERVQEDVCERLSYSGLDVSDVSVQVSQSKVTLSGTVGDRRTKHAIEDCADDCLGVQDVDNRISVRRPGAAHAESPATAKSEASSPGAHSNTPDTSRNGKS